MKNEFIQKITFMSRLLRNKKEKDAKQTNEWNVTHDYYYHRCYACISSFQHQHYHQTMIENISKLFCFTFFRPLGPEMFGFWAWLTSILKTIYCRSKFFALKIGL